MAWRHCNTYEPNTLYSYTLYTHIQGRDIEYSKSGVWKRCFIANDLWRLLWSSISYVWECCAVTWPSRATTLPGSSAVLYTQNTNFGISTIVLFIHILQINIYESVKHKFHKLWLHTESETAYYTISGAQFWLLENRNTLLLKRWDDETVMKEYTHTQTDSDLAVDMETLFLFSYSLCAHRLLLHSFIYENVYT